MKRIISRNFFKNRERTVYKILSILIAAGIWAYVLSSKSLVVEKKITLKLLAPSDVVIGNIVDSEITVKVEGPKIMIRDFLEKPDELSVDLKKFRQKNSINFNLNQLFDDLPMGVRIISISPSKLIINLVEKSSKVVPIKYSVNSPWVKDFKFEVGKIVPENALLTGPEVVLNKIDSISTSSIDIGVNDFSGKKSIILNRPDSRINIVESESYIFEYKLVPKASNLLLKKIPIEFEDNNQDYFSKNKFASIAVFVQGKYDLDDIRDDLKIVAIISKEEKRGERTIKLEAKLPDSVYLVKIIPDSIKVNIK